MSALGGLLGAAAASVPLIRLINSLCLEPFQILIEKRITPARDWGSEILPGRSTDEISKGLPVGEGTERVRTVDGPILSADVMSELVARAEALESVAHRVNLPPHKQGATMDGPSLYERKEPFVDLYLSKEWQDMVSHVLGAKVEPITMSHPSTCSLLYYTQEGDHIAWHYDHNMFQGDYYTVLVPLVNEGETDNGLSASRFCFRERHPFGLHALGVGKTHAVELPRNSMVAFEGPKLWHKAEKVKAGDRRIIWSMVYATSSKQLGYREVLRRIKDVSYIGLRALRRGKAI